MPTTSIVLLNGDGLRLPVTRMWGPDGKETRDRTQVRKCVAELPDGQWLATQCEPDDLEYVQ